MDSLTGQPTSAQEGRVLTDDCSSILLAALQSSNQVAHDQLHHNDLQGPTNYKVPPTDGFHGAFYHGDWRALHHHAACWLVNIHITWHFCPPVSMV